MIGKMTRMAFTAWFIGDEAWARYGEMQDEGRHDTLRRRLKEANRLSLLLDETPGVRAVVFRGDGADEIVMPQLETHFCGVGIHTPLGEMDPHLVQFDPSVCPDGRSAFEGFVDFLRHIDFKYDEKKFQAVMLYLRTLPCSVREPTTRTRKMYAVRKVEDDPDYPHPETLPWLFSSAKKAKNALGRLAVSAAKSSWDKYRIVVDRGECVVEKLPCRSAEERQYHCYADERLLLKVKTIDVPKDFAAVADADRNWFVENWNLLRTKCWDTKNLGHEEWLLKLDPCTYHGDAKERSRLAYEAAEKCDWWKIDLDRLQQQEWVLVLRHRPDWADKCPCWSSFSDFEWCRLLGRQPQFMDRIPEHLVFMPRHWSFLLRRQPQFADRCSCWNEMDSFALKLLLADQPQFVKRLDLAQLDGEHWVSVIKCCPDYADRCPWKLLNESEWVDLLSECPQYANLCDWQKIDGCMWIDLLRLQPELKEYCDWSKLDGWMMKQIIYLNRSFAVHADWSKFSSSDWADLLVSFPDFIDKCDPDKVEVADWCKILSAQPNLADRFTQWDQLTKEQLLQLLEKSSVFCPYVDFASLPVSTRIDCMLLCPEFTDKMAWSDIDDIDDWYRILSARPDLACHFTKWDQLTKDQKLHLLQKSDTFCLCVDFASLPLATRIDYLLLRPEFADKMNWEDVVDPCDWYRLMAVIPACQKYAPSDAVIPESKGHAWLGKSGPVIVIPRQGTTWNEECPPFAVGNRERLGQYRDTGYGVEWNGDNGYHDSMSSECATAVVNHVLSAKTAEGACAIDIEGVYVDVSGWDGKNGRKIAGILKKWFAEHESSIKIVHLECGDVYPMGSL